MDIKEFVIADSGAREQHSTGAVRDIRRGKGRFDLVTPVADRRVALVYEGGAVKYEDRNWEKGMPFSRFLDSAQRHINDYKMIALYKREGKPLSELPPDINPNEDHLAQAIWNLKGLIQMEEMHPELDDLTRKGLEPGGVITAPQIQAGLIVPQRQGGFGLHQGGLDKEGLKRAAFLADEEGLDIVAQGLRRMAEDYPDPDQKERKRV